MVFEGFRFGFQGARSRRVWKIPSFRVWRVYGILELEIKLCAGQ